MSLARTLRNDQEKMGEHPLYRPSQGHGQSQTQSQRTAGAAGGRLRRNDDPLAELARLIGQEDPFKEFDAVQPRRPVSKNGGAYPAGAPTELRAERNGTNGVRVAASSAVPHQRNGYSEAAEFYRTPSRNVRPPVVASTAPAPVRPKPDGFEERNSAPRPAKQIPQPALPLLAKSHNPARPAQNPTSVPRPAATDSGHARQFNRSRESYPDDISVRPARTSTKASMAPASHTDSESLLHVPLDESAGYFVPEQAPRHARARPQPAAYQEPQYQRGYEHDYDPEYDDDAYLQDHPDDVYDDVQPRRGLGFWIVGAIVLASLIAVAFLGMFAYRAVFNTPPRAAVVTKSDAPVKVEPKNTPQAIIPQSNKPIQDRLGGSAESQVMRREEAPVDLTRPPATQPVQQPPAQAVQPLPPQIQRAPQVAPQPQQPSPQADQPKRVKSISVRSDGNVPQPAPQQNNAPLPLNAAPQEPDTQAIPPQNRPNSSVPPANRNVASLGPAPVQTGGNYVVQVASHKTPEEAQNAWNGLRQQYGSIFGGRNADIRKVDLGDRGTFYRAMVGPMNREQANALCQNLKTQGAGCIVQTR